MRRAGLTLAFALLGAGALSPRTISSQTIAAPPPATPPYVRRGDEVERHYQQYRQRLAMFFDTLHKRLEADAPQLLSSIEPPAPVPYGYQIVPALISDPPGAARKPGIALSPFSWRRLELSVERDGKKLDTLNARFADSARAAAEGLRGYSGIAGEYKRLVASQKLIENQMQYNRFWQGDIATHQIWYGKLKRLQGVAIERQRINDSLALVGSQFRESLRTRADSLTRQIDDWLKKSPTPDFVEVDRPEPHRWVVRVPVYTDIQDTAFVEGFREAIETGWRVRGGADEFGVKLDIRRVSPSVLYQGGSIPARGTHIDLDAHAARFPQDGVVLTTGGNAVRALVRAIVLSPFAIKKSTLVHEFGHMLGFKDGYFRSYDDRGSEGYEVLEVILDPHDVVAAPEGGLVRREHFEQIIRERESVL